MSWLRIDDKFARHPKILKLPRPDRWTWIELLCYCAEYQTKGYVPPAIGDALRYVTPAFIRKAVTAGLLEEAPDGLLVHDWGDYNGRDPKIMQTERKRKQRDKTPDPAVTSAGTNAGQTPGHEPGQLPGHGRDENVTRAQARARVPVPQPQVLDQEQDQEPFLPAEVHYEAGRQDEFNRIDPADELAATIAAARAEAGLE